MAIIKLSPSAFPSTYEIENTPSFKELKRLVVHVNGCIRIINIEQIEYLQADSNYSHIYLINGERLLISKTLKSIWPKLDNTFIKVHKSNIINLRHIYSYSPKDSILKMLSGDIINISRSNKALLRKVLTQ